LTPRLGFVLKAILILGLQLKKLATAKTTERGATAKFQQDGVTVGVWLASGHNREREMINGLTVYRSVLDFVSIS
jgi:uncharacterized protein YebE (UPF0316 family)